MTSRTPPGQTPPGQTLPDLTLPDLTLPDRTLPELWRALGGAPALLERVVAAPPDKTLDSRLPVADLATGSVAALSLAAASLYAVRRTGRRPLAGELPPVTVDTRAVAGCFRGDQLLRLDGRASPAWSPFSGFLAASDGWVRTHGNYPHHAVRLLETVGLPPDAAPGDLRAAVARWPARDLEERAAGHGAIAAAARTPADWAGTAQARALRQVPLLEIRALSPAAALAAPPLEPDARPLTGVRVLDLSRVVAGPTASQALSLLGADVLRVDPPAPAEIEWQHLDTGGDKRSTLLDLREPAGRHTLLRLLADADVLVSGYRPGALERFGLGAHVLAEAHPGLVVAVLSAWGPQGPWSGRRGFDSIVQAATGIAIRESRDGITPGVLPAQALDRATGMMLAAGVVEALQRRLLDGGSWLVTAHLAATARWLLGGPADGRPFERSDDELPLTTRDTPAGRLTYPTPAVRFGPDAIDYRHPGQHWGADPAEWQPR